MDLVGVTGIVGGGLVGAGLMLSHLKTARLKKHPASFADEISTCAFCSKPAVDFDDRVHRWVCEDHAEQVSYERGHAGRMGDPYADEREADREDLAALDAVEELEEDERGETEPIARSPRLQPVQRQRRAVQQPPQRAQQLLQPLQGAQRRQQPLQRAQQRQQPLQPLQGAQRRQPSRQRAWPMRWRCPNCGGAGDMINPGEPVYECAPCELAWSFRWTGQSWRMVEVEVQA
jgi:FtsZ-interacting cell division protein ZipA